MLTYRVLVSIVASVSTLFIELSETAQVALPMQFVAALTQNSPNYTFTVAICKRIYCSVIQGLSGSFDLIFGHFHPLINVIALCAYHNNRSNSGQEKKLRMKYLHDITKLSMSSLFITNKIDLIRHIWFISVPNCTVKNCTWAEEIK